MKSYKDLIPLHIFRPIQIFQRRQRTRRTTPPDIQVSILDSKYIVLRTNCTTSMRYDIPSDYSDSSLRMLSQIHLIESLTSFNLTNLTKAMVIIHTDTKELSKSSTNLDPNDRSGSLICHPLLFSSRGVLPSLTVVYLGHRTTPHHTTPNHTTRRQIPGIRWEIELRFGC